MRFASDLLAEQKKKKNRKKHMSVTNLKQGARLENSKRFRSAIAKVSRRESDPEADGWVNRCCQLP